MGSLYTPTKRKIGSGYIYFAPHATTGDEAGVPFDGEKALTAMWVLALAKAEATALGGASADMEFIHEAEWILDEISQEGYPVQGFAASGKATFKFTLNAGNADKLAFAVGLCFVSGTNPAQESDVLGSDDDADTLLVGVRKPSLITLLSVVRNSQVSGDWFDCIYMPRVQIDPSFTLAFAKKAVREVEVTAHVMASHQDGTTGGSTDSEDMYIDPNDSFACAKILYQTAT